MKQSIQDQLMAEIVLTTGIIQAKFPELYLHLSETPLFLSYKSMQLERLDFIHYLESLKLQLNEFEKEALQKVN